MVLEIADFLIREGDEDSFLVAYRGAVQLIIDSPGCRGVQLVRGVENPGRFVLLVRWERLEDHTVGFRESPSFTAWRAAVGRFFAQPPQVEHAVDVA